MSALEIALHMWPMWLLGLIMILITVKSGNKDLLAIKKSSVLKWIAFLGFISVVRFIGFYFLWDILVDKFSAISWIPWQTTLMVWWEDAAYTLPLLLLARVIGMEKKTWPIHILAGLVIWASFASGHLYQGLSSALFVSLYIPYSYFESKDKGLGTFMICHVLYDLVTLLLVQGMLRFM